MTRGSIMECERCKKNEATIHLTEIIKDVKSEVHLCEACAREVGLNAKLSNFSLSMPEMLSFLDLTEIDNTAEDFYCKVCGYSYLEYNKTGQLGCPDCYISFKESLDSIISGYHGDKKHMGKFPRYSSDSFKESIAVKTYMRVDSVEGIKKELDLAVFEERYEDAAVLRDRLKELKSEGAEL